MIRPGSWTFQNHGFVIISSRAKAFGNFEFGHPVHRMIKFLEGNLDNVKCVFHFIIMITSTVSFKKHRYNYEMTLE